MKKPKVTSRKPVRRKAAQIPKKRKKKKRKATDYDRAIRWNLSKASREFGCAREIMERRRREYHIEPGKDERFSTREICAMVFTDKQQADARKAEADAQAAERKNLREASELIPTAIAAKAMDPILIMLRQQICSAPITDAEKDNMLAGIESGFAGIDWKSVAREA